MMRLTAQSSTHGTPMTHTSPTGKPLTLTLTVTWSRDRIHPSSVTSCVTLQNNPHNSEHFAEGLIMRNHIPSAVTSSLVSLCSSAASSVVQSTSSFAHNTHCRDLFCRSLPRSLLRAKAIPQSTLECCFVSCDDQTKHSYSD